LLRLVRALASFGVFVLDRAEKVAHSPLSRLLRQDAAPSRSASARFYPGTVDWSAWEALDVALRGEAVPFEHVCGMTRFAYLEAHPKLGRLFDAVMAEAVTDWFEAIATASPNLDRPDALIADIGGGSGALLRALIRRYPDARGLLMDRPAVVNALSPADLLEGRIDTIAGEFQANTLPAADIYVLSRILHDWDDPTCRDILRWCRAAMSPDAKLWIVERVLPDDPVLCSQLDALVDMQMMVMLPGRERSLAEFTALLRASGFGPPDLLSANRTASILLCRPV
jgi:hypothetical protein